MFPYSKQPFTYVVSAQAAHFLIALGLFGAMLGCTPAFNWREVSFDSLPVSALLPCKPDRGTRSVPLAGAQYEMVMAGCETGGATFTVAVVNTQDLAKVPGVLAQLRGANKATQSRYLQHGPWVVQASIYGTPSAERDGPGAFSNEVAETFFKGITLAGKL